MAEKLQHTQEKIGFSLSDILERFIFNDAIKTADKRGLDYNSTEARLYQREVETMLTELDTKYARTLEALAENIDVTQYVNVKENDMLSRYLKGQANLHELFTAMKENQIEVYSEDAEKAYFQSSGRAMYGMRPSSRLVAHFERERYQKMAECQKAQSAEKKRTLAAESTKKKQTLATELEKYDREAKRKKTARDARRKDMDYLAQEEIKRYKNFIYSGKEERAKIDRIKNDQKENKKLIKMSDKETKLRRKVLEFACKSELGLLTEKEQTKYGKAQNELIRFLEEKELFKQQIKTRITEEMKNKSDLALSQADRDYKAMRFEQLDCEDYSYTVLHNDAEIAISNGAIPIDLREKSKSELMAHYEEKAQRYAPDVQERLTRVEANRNAQRNWRANRIEEMNAAREREMHETVREKFLLKESETDGKEKNKTKTNSENQKEAEEKEQKKDEAQVKEADDLIL